MQAQSEALTIPPDVMRIADAVWAKNGDRLKLVVDSPDLDPDQKTAVMGSLIGKDPAFTQYAASVSNTPANARCIGAAIAVGSLALAVYAVYRIATAGAPKK